MSEKISLDSSDKTNIINKRHIITFVPYKYE